VLLACVFLVGWCTCFSCSSCYCYLARRGKQLVCCGNFLRMRDEQSE
jgi:hypothetical protein